MKLNYTFMVIVLIAAVVFSYCVTADSKEDVADKKNQVLSKTNDGVNVTIDPVKNGKASNSVKNDSNEQSNSREAENEKKKVDGGALKENEESYSESKNESKEGRLPPVREKCDSSSNRCTDDDKTLVACLRVPGNEWVNLLSCTPGGCIHKPDSVYGKNDQNFALCPPESPALSLLIQNMGKGSLSITISAPDSVQLEKKQIELQENKDTEVNVSIRGVESGHFIILSAGHGNCSLNFRDQFMGMKKVGDSHDSSYFNSIFKLTLSKGFLFTAALLLLVVSVFMSTKLGRKYFARKDHKYQKLDMELPVSHGSKLESSENEGWDESWGDDWDDEETPITPSLPVTPSLSSKGMASRKFSKEGWKD